MYETGVGREGPHVGGGKDNIQCQPHMLKVERLCLILYASSRTSAFVGRLYPSGAINVKVAPPT